MVAVNTKHVYLKIASLFVLEKFEIYVTRRYVTSRYAALRYATLRYVTLRYAMPRYVTLRNKVYNTVSPEKTERLSNSNAILRRKKTLQLYFIAFCCILMKLQLPKD